MSLKTLLVTEDDGIVTITLNRPEKKNAMNPTLHVEMDQVLTDLENRGDVRVLIITGAGDAFCAGMDLKEYFLELKDRPHDMDRIRQISQEWRDRKLRLFGAPTIAMINGHCFGGGFSIVAACDLAITSEDAKFGLSEVNFGQLPAGPVSLNMGELLSDRDALWYMLTGESFDGRRAAEIGLVNKVVPAAELGETVAALARSLREKNPHTLRLTKHLYRHTKGMDRDAALNYANAKVRELTYLTKGEWLEQGIGQFLRGEYRPGFGTYKPVEADDKATDQT
jgi:trans-feruloyl-CoA hydratase/vanillin synthase